MSANEAHFDGQTGDNNIAWKKTDYDLDNNNNITISYCLTMLFGRLNTRSFPENSENIN